MWWLWRHRLAVTLLVAAVVGIAALGATVGARRTGTAPVPGFVCSDAGRRTWMRERRRHPRWTTLRLYSATHVCRRAPWRY
jgi:hypothetical protein